MHNHRPSDYVCPFCLIAAGVENEHVWTVHSDLVLRTSQVCAFISARQWPNNQGHVVVIPNEHHENIYDLLVELARPIHAAARDIAVAMKAVYGCDGISTRQHNEPAGNQDVWHYHLHVFPRYAGDGLYGSQPCYMEVACRARYACRLREWLHGSDERCE